MISKKRKNLGYTQEEVAKLLNITLRHYIRIEHNEITPNVITALSICKILSLDPFKIWKV